MPIILRLQNYVARHFIELLRFTLVGVSTFLINFLSVYLFYGALHLDYRLAASLAYIITTCCHFMLNKSFTFGASEQKLRHNAPRYALMLALNYAITILASWLTVGIFGGSPYLGVVASTGGTALSSFFVMKYFVFGGTAATSIPVSREAPQKSGFLR